MVSSRWSAGRKARFRPHAGELVHVAHQNQTAGKGQRGEHCVEQPGIQHTGLVHHQNVRFELVVLAS